MTQDPVLHGPQGLLAFLDDSPTPYHAVAAASALLVAHGAERLDARDDWSRLAPGAYFVEHMASTLFAFTVPDKPLSCFRIVGAHTDSPNLRLKTNAHYTKEGYSQLGVETYGGLLPNSWLDRDLSVAGRLFARDIEGTLATHLVRIDRPLLRIAQLAVHLDRDQGERLVLNKQEHLAPILGLSSEDPATLLGECALDAGVSPELVEGLELMLFDTQAAAVGGMNREFVFSARLDNLAMSHAATTALGEFTSAASSDGACPLIALFDHEEIGSGSAQGAESSALPRLLSRIARAQKLDDESYARALERSSCLSADMAHAVHPNYADKHEPRHKPQLNGGPVIKMNSQQRYATRKESLIALESLARSVHVPVQHYIHRTDLPCGSTIGPITAALLGIPTADVGNAMLSMHSAREMTGAQDPARMVALMRAFFARGFAA